jgi:hypothetical protein
MSVPQLNHEDHELVSALRATWTEAFDERVEPLKKQIAAIGARSSRAPGSAIETTALDVPASLSRQLLDDGAFQNWIKSPSAKFLPCAIELRRPPARKAATPITGLSPTQYLPQKLWGHPLFPLRLREIVPTVFVESGVVEYTVETA